jgi:hypothetical protein
VLTPFYPGRQAQVRPWSGAAGLWSRASARSRRARGRLHMPVSPGKVASPNGSHQNRVPTSIRPTDAPSFRKVKKSPARERRDRRQTYTQMKRQIAFESFPDGKAAGSGDKVKSFPCVHQSPRFFFLNALPAPPLSSDPFLSRPSFHSLDDNPPFKSEPTGHSKTLQLLSHSFLCGPLRSSATSALKSNLQPSHQRRGFSSARAGGIRPASSWLSGAPGQALLSRQRA